jgi:predicted dehydrogenase
MASLSRRRFVQGAAAASVAFPLFTIGGTKASGKVIGANDTVRIGVAGTGGRGGSHIGEWTSQEKVQITYLIDPDTRKSNSAAERVEGRSKSRPKTVQDVRQALDDKELDAISIATCNHWHSLITIWACQAGKDVYVEKPISHNVFEGRKCVEAAKKYNRVVQHGTQSRSSLSFARAVAAVHSGKYGKLLVSRGSASKPGSGRSSIGYRPNSTPPSSFDFNLWLGPAPLQPFHANLHPYNWHWFWDTGNGEIGNQGVHQMDIARWGIKGSNLPTKIYSVGGRFLADGPDQAQTPNMQLAAMEFGDGGPILLFEVRGLTGKHPDYPQDVSNSFYTTDGVIKTAPGGRRGGGEGGYMFFPKNGGDPQKLVVDEPKITVADAFPAFINAIRTRKPEDNNCDAEVAHYSAACCHLANISYRLGSGDPKNYEKARGLIKDNGDNKEVVAGLEKLHNNCKALGIPIDDASYMIGAVLKFDPAAERFVGSDEQTAAANKLLRRDYRDPFIVPENV